MKNDNYTCFFISPIGDEGSKERKESDIVLKRILRPALYSFGIPKEAVIRSDMDDRPGLITHQMINHLNSSDICVADLTGLNPNVMFELGYRKGLGKPVIIVASKDTEPILPFDVKSERIIFYDLNDTESWDDTEDAIERQAKQLIESGALDMKKVVDEEAIFMRLNAIEQKLEMVFSRTQVDMLPENISEDNGEINEDEFETAHPLEAMAVYLKEGNVVKAERMLGRLESRLNVDGFLALIPPMLALGSLKAASIFKSRLQTIRQQDEGTRLTLIGAYVTYCNIKNFEPEEYDFIDVELTELAKQSQTAELRIQILNQRNRIAYGAYATLENRGEPNEVFRKKAIESLDEAIKLDSGFTLPSLWYNRALILFDMGDVDRAKEDVDIYLLHQTDGKDFDQLALAYKVYRKIGDKERMYFIEKEMRELDPRRLKALKITLD